MLKPKPIFILLLIAILAALLTTCASVKFAPQAGVVPHDFVPAKHIVFIVLDGWGGAYVPEANMPTVKRMMSNGAWSLNAQCVMPSSSWPNWSSIFCGAPPVVRTVDAKKEASLNRSVRMIDYFPSIFTQIKKEGQTKKSVFFYEWEELTNICPDDATEKKLILSDIESTNNIAAYIKEQKPFFTAIGYDEPDFTGHKKGWGSKAYYDKLKEMDDLIAFIEQAVKDAGIYDDTVFVLTTDHGGVFKGHGPNLPKLRNIPLIFFGCSIKKGFNIPSPINNYDVTPTMAAILGIEIPPEWTGRILYEIFK